MPKNNSRARREQRRKEATERQEAWDALSEEERKEKVEARGYHLELAVVDEMRK